jgi:hypothetical protein
MTERDAKRKPPHNKIERPILSPAMEESALLMRQRKFHVLINNKALIFGYKTRLKSSSLERQVKCLVVNAIFLVKEATSWFAKV